MLAQSHSGKEADTSKTVAQDQDMVRTKASFTAKRRTIIATSTVITFALMLGLLRQAISQHFFFMASGLLVEFAWLMAAIMTCPNPPAFSTFRIFGIR